MAQDLTPLPPLGERVAAATAQPTAASAGPATPVRMPHRRRFRLAFALLLLLATAALAGIVLLALGGRSGDTPWSSWKPSASGFEGAQQIAEQVGGRYRTATGAELREVVAGPLLVPEQVDVAGQAVLTPAGLARISKKPRGAFQIVPPGADILFYQLIVPNQANPGPATTPNGLVLLRREAVELSLHAFRYLPEFQRVLVFIQTSGRNQPNYGVLLRRRDLGAEISHPLKDTLSASTPLETRIPTGDKQEVLRITQGHVFQPTLSHAPDGTPFIILADP